MTKKKNFAAALVGTRRLWIMYDGDCSCLKVETEDKKKKRERQREGERKWEKETQVRRRADKSMHAHPFKSARRWRGKVRSKIH